MDTTKTDIGLIAAHVQIDKPLLQDMTDGAGIFYLCPAVIIFAMEMQKKLDEQKDKGDMYKKCTYAMLFAGLDKEFDELHFASEAEDVVAEDVVKGCANVANMAMFIALNAMNGRNQCG